MPDLTPADRLRTAANFLRYGYGTGHLCDGEGNRCVIGALLAETPSEVLLDGDGREMTLLLGDRLADAASQTLHRYLSTQPSPFVSVGTFRKRNRVDELMWWNDMSEMDGETAAAVLEKAAAWTEEA